MLTIDLKRIQFKPGDRVLDLGCGEGRHALGIMAELESLQIFGIDLSFKDLNTAQSRKQDLPQQSATVFAQADGKQLPFADASFDTIICSEVLEHIIDYAAFLNEIQRVLKPEGQLIVSVPRYWPEKICWKLEKAYYKVEGGHVRIFKFNELKAAIQKTGFDFKEHHWAHALHSPYWWLRCMFWSKGESQPLVKLYHRMLVWDLFHKPWITQSLEKLFNPLIGKSVVLYFRKRI